MYQGYTYGGQVENYVPYDYNNYFYQLGYEYDWYGNVKSEPGVFTPPSAVSNLTEIPAASSTVHEQQKQQETASAPKNVQPESETQKVTTGRGHKRKTVVPTEQSTEQTPTPAKKLRSSSRRELFKPDDVTIQQSDQKEEKDIKIPDELKDDM